MRILARCWWIGMAVGWLGASVGGCDIEGDGSVFDCDPETQACGSEPASDDPGSAGEGGDEGCVGEQCDPGEPDPDPEPEPEPTDDDGRGDDDDSGGTCLKQYEACLEQGVTPEACGAQREACDDDPRGGDDEPSCSEVEVEGSGPFGGDNQEEAWLRCYDSLDADCDGLVDCEDPDCDFVCDPGGDSGGDQSGDHCYQTPDAACYGCACVPGTVRDCHVPGPCTWGKSTCLDDGTWGACEDTGDVPPACDQGGFGSAYDVTCCVDAGRCCENLDYDYSLYDNTEGAHASVGNCGQVCAEPAT